MPTQKEAHTDADEYAAIGTHCPMSAKAPWTRRSHTPLPESSASGQSRQAVGGRHHHRRRFFALPPTRDVSQSRRSSAPLSATYVGHLRAPSDTSHGDGSDQLGTSTSTRTRFVERSDVILIVGATPPTGPPGLSPSEHEKRRRQSAESSARFRACTNIRAHAHVEADYHLPLGRGTTSPLDAISHVIVTRELIDEVHRERAATGTIPGSGPRSSPSRHATARRA